MKTFITTILITLFAIPVYANDLITRLVDKTISNLERDQVVTELKLVEDFTVNDAAGILTAIAKHRSPMEPGMPRAWMDDSYSVNAKIWYASSEIWDAWFASSKKSAERTEILIILLNKNIDTYTVFNQLKLSFWTNSAEQAAYNLATAENVDVGIRSMAYEVLLKQTNESYVLEAIDFVKSFPIDDQARKFNSLFNFGNKFYTYPQSIQNELIEYGFVLLDMQVEESLRKGYFTATKLGYWLKIPNGFKPDQKLPKYKTKSGLAKSFFEDTVKNALQWKKNNLATSN